MRKFFTITVIFSVIITAVYLASCKGGKKDPEPTDNKDSLANVVKRGEYLANHVAMCMDCHSQRDFNQYSGPVIPGTEGGGGYVFDHKEGIPGILYGKNITPDDETGIGTWTDDEILRAMTQGINKKGDTLFPLMPYVTFNRMAKDDLLSIIAYIKTLKAIKNAVPARALQVPIGVVYPGPALQASVDGNVRPPESDQIKYGQYMTMFSLCGDCHSPLTPQGPDMSKMFAGGYTFDMGTYKVNSANITPDSATGLGTWTEERFMNKFILYREEKSYNFKVEKENTYMPLSAYAGMTDSDLKAIYAFLKTVKPINNLVVKYPK